MANGCIRTVPDLEDGFIINSFDSRNRWRTNVECVLKRTDGSGEEEYSYLSSECRAESVSEDIFSTNIPRRNLHEFCRVVTWDGTLILRHGSVLYGMNPFISRQHPSEKRYRIMDRPNGSVNYVGCDLKNAKYLSFEDAFLHVDKGAHNRIYMDIEYFQGDHTYNLYAPARYTNYPNIEMQAEKYLQPISGYVLHEFNSRFYLAYVACHIRKEGTRSTQFICRDQIGFLGTKVWASRLWLPAILFLDRILFRHFFVTDEFHLVKEVNGSCSFFVYD